MEKASSQRIRWFPALPNRDHLRTVMVGDLSFVCPYVTPSTQLLSKITVRIFFNLSVNMNIAWMSISPVNQKPVSGFLGVINGFSCIALAKASHLPFSLLQYTPLTCNWRNCSQSLCLSTVPPMGNWMKSSNQLETVKKTDTGHLKVPERFWSL